MEWLFLLFLFVMLNAASGSNQTRQLPAGDLVRLPPGSRFLLRIHRLWVEPVVQIGRRFGVKVHASLEILGAQGHPIAYQVSFRRVGREEVRSRASRYYGPEGRLFGSAVTRPVQNAAASYPDLWVFLPFGAFELELGVHPLEACLEVTVDGVPLGSSTSRFLMVQPEGDPGEGRTVQPDEFAIVEAAHGTTPSCAICNERVTGEAYVCPQCETLHHLDCWKYNEGCATYGCTKAR